MGDTGEDLDSLPTSTAELRRRRLIFFCRKDPVAAEAHSASGAVADHFDTVVSDPVAADASVAAVADANLVVISSTSSE